MSEVRFEILESMKLVGMRMPMTLAEDRTGLLWRQFMPRRGEIGRRTDQSFVSMQVVEGGARAFTPESPFAKWAAVAVEDFSAVPEGMETYVVDGGEYAIFPHRGTAESSVRKLIWIWTTWLPASEYELDDREQFEILSEHYRPDDPEAEEDLWIPIQRESGR